MHACSRGAACWAELALFPLAAVREEDEKCWPDLDDRPRSDLNAEVRGARRGASGAHPIGERASRPFRKPVEIGAAIGDGGDPPAVTEYVRLLRRHACPPELNGGARRGGGQNDRVRWRRWIADGEPQDGAGRRRERHRCRPCAVFFDVGLLKLKGHRRGTGIDEGGASRVVTPPACSYLEPGAE